MIAFHGNADMKARFVQRAQNIATSFTRGLLTLTEGQHAWQVRDKQTALIPANDAARDRTGAEFGIPSRLAYAHAGLFYSLQENAAVNWPLQFAKAIPCGADLDNVWRDFALFVLADPKVGLAQHAQTARQTTAIENIIRLFVENSQDAEAWSAAADEARTASSFTWRGGHGNNAMECMQSVGGTAAYSAYLFADAFAKPECAHHAVSEAAWPLRHLAEYHHHVAGESYAPKVNERDMVNLGEAMFCGMMNRREYDKAAHQGELDRWAMNAVYASKLVELIKARAPRRPWFTAARAMFAPFARTENESAKSE